MYPRLLQLGKISEILRKDIYKLPSYLCSFLSYCSLEWLTKLDYKKKQNFLLNNDSKSLASTCSGNALKEKKDTNKHMMRTLRAHVKNATFKKHVATEHPRWWYRVPKGHWVQFENTNTHTPPPCHRGQEVEWMIDNSRIGPSPFTLRSEPT